MSVLFPLFRKSFASAEALACFHGVFVSYKGSSVHREGSNRHQNSSQEESLHALMMVNLLAAVDDSGVNRLTEVVCLNSRLYYV